MSWINKRKDIGDVKIGQSTNIEFNHSGNIKPIKHLSSSCGCSIPYYDEKNNCIKVTYTPGSIPVHLRDTQNFYIIPSKSITIKYKDGSEEILSFYGKAIK